MRLPLLAIIAALALAPAAAANGPVPSNSDGALERGGSSGLPLPRFVSLASKEVNVRMGPSFGHKVKWTFKKDGLPVEVVREFGNWRQIRDSEGEDGWVHHSLLSGRRTVLVSPWADADTVPLRAAPDSTARPTAFLEPFVLATVDRCDGSWCAIHGASWRGNVPQRLLWGVYPREEVR